MDGVWSYKSSKKMLKELVGTAVKIVGLYLRKLGVYFFLGLE